MDAWGQPYQLIAKWLALPLAVQKRRKPYPALHRAGPRARQVDGFARGRPVSLEFSPALGMLAASTAFAGMNTFLGFDIGGSKCAVLVGTSEGRVLAREEWPSKAAQGPELMLEKMQSRAKNFLCNYPAICGAGVSIGGPLDAARGIIHSPPNLPGWDALPLKQQLEEALELPVRVEHDAAACALAEWRWGAGRGQSRVIYLTCGTGFGAGIVLDGRPYYGEGGRSPEVGHWRYAEDGPVAFGKRGSVEAFCSGSGLSKLAAWQFPEKWASDPPSGPRLAAAAAQGDIDAQAVLAINARAVGRVAAQLADLFRPGCIILGSLARYLGEPWLENVRGAFAGEILDAVHDPVLLLPSALADRLQDCSALAAAMPYGKAANP